MQLAHQLVHHVKTLVFTTIVNQSTVTVLGSLLEKTLVNHTVGVK